MYEVRHYYIAIIALVSAGIAAWFFEPTGWLAAAFGAFVIAFGIMRYATLNILTISYRKKLYDEPGKRRIHKTPVPRLGGLAFAPVLACAVILGLSLHSVIAPSFHSPVANCMTWVCALIFIHMTGTIDDMIGVRYLVKLTSQIIAALLVVSSGLQIDNLYGFFGINALPAAAAIPLTVLFIVFVINAVNLIDGMDGLAAGLGIMILSIYGVQSFIAGNYFLTVVAFAALGTIIPFLYANVRGFGSSRHKLFMGDTGSQTLGLVISVLAVGLIANTGTELVKQNFILALSPLLLPAFDVVHVVISRLKRGCHPFLPDMTHIHHRLLGKGFTSRQSVMLILGLAAFYTVVNMLLAPYMNVTLIFALDVAIWCIFDSRALSPVKRRVERKTKTIRHTILERKHKQL